MIGDFQNDSNFADLGTQLNAIPISVGVFEIVNDELQIRYMSDEYYAMVGETREARTARTQNKLENYIYQEDLERVYTAMHNLINGTDRTSINYRITKADGQLSWLKLNAKVSSRSFRKIVFYATIICVDQDVSIRRELMEKASVLSLAVGSVKMHVWSYDCKTRRLTLQPIGEQPNDLPGIIDNVPESMIEDRSIHPDYAALFRDFFAALGESNATMRTDILVHHHEKEPYWWQQVSLTPIFENGIMTRALYTACNITDHKEKEIHYEKLIGCMEEENGENLIAKGRHNLTQNTVCFYYENSGTAVKLRSTIYDDALNSLMQTAATPDQAELVREKLNRQALLRDYSAGKNQDSFQYKRKASDSVEFWSLMKYSMVEEPNTGDIILFVYSYDITEQIWERNIASILSTAEYDLMVLLNVLSGQYELRDPAVSGPFKTMAHGGSNVGSVIHERLIDIGVPKAEREELERQMSISSIVENLKQQKSFFLTYAVDDPQLGRRTKKLQFCYLDETKTTVLACRSDITDTYQREQEHLRRIEEALSAARHANDSKTEFFSRMSHDMRTPMNGILGIAHLAMDEHDPEALRDSMSKIIGEGEYLLNLINDTLDFQKIENGKMVLEPQVVLAQDVIDDSCSMVRVTAEKKGVNLRVDVGNANTRQSLRIDPLRTKQIFMNLLSNAVKFTPVGGTVALSFQVVRRAADRAHVRITVADTGIGMSREFLENGIFKPFSQESNGITSVSAGTGLGLSIAKQLVEMMGGTIRVESEQGSGTTFTVELDFECVDEEEATKSVAVDVAQKATYMEAIRGKKLLLAEDHPLNAEIAKKLLGRAGCVVTWAQNGQDCINAFVGAPTGFFDAILMDIRMPLIDGLEATRRIRAMERPDAQTIPIIAMTANAYVEDVKVSLDVGMNDHLAKPINPTLMYGTIAKWTR
jgi:signal transduction histidine kinase